jgi:hypothetical protein
MQPRVKFSEFLVTDQLALATVVLLSAGTESPVNIKSACNGNFESQFPSVLENNCLFCMI